MRLVLSFITSALIAFSQVEAHGHERSMHPREIASRQLEANDRHIVARRCAPQIAAYQRKRKLERRSILAARDVTGTDSALQPHETTIKNDTCVTAPEVTKGPYYLNNEIVRQDLRDDQGGILLELDIGVIDTSTCQPLPSVLVEIWNCNATGHYSGFTTSAILGPPTGDNSTASLPSFSGDVPSANKTDNLNFLRGAWQTNDQGIVTFNTIYPGFYTGRTVHTHIMVHQNVTYNSNGTYSTQSGSVIHVGQAFFDDALNDQIMATSPYNTTTMQRTYNDADSILAQGNSNGYSAFVDASLIGADVVDGILGFITVGVDSTASYSVESPNYYATGDLYEPVTSDSTSYIFESTTSRLTTSLGIITSSVASRHVTSSSPGHFYPPDQGQGHDHGHDDGHGPHNN